jgi:hypothetical protein
MRPTISLPSFEPLMCLGVGLNSGFYSTPAFASRTTDSCLSNVRAADYVGFWAGSPFRHPVVIIILEVLEDGLRVVIPLAICSAVAYCFMSEIPS